MDTGIVFLSNSHGHFFIFSHTLLFTALIQIAELFIPRQQMAVAVYEDQLFAIGGFEDSGISKMIECYKVAKNKWVRIEALPRDMLNCCATIG